MSDDVSIIGIIDDLQFADEASLEKGDAINSWGAASAIDDNNDEQRL